MNPYLRDGLSILGVFVSAYAISIAIRAMHTVPDVQAPQQDPANANGPPISTGATGGPTTPPPPPTPPAPPPPPSAATMKKAIVGSQSQMMANRVRKYGLGLPSGATTPVTPKAPISVTKTTRTGKG